MSRLATSILVLAAVLGTPSYAADWGSSPEDIYREGYSMEPADWTEFGDDSDGIHIETGLRYWYSMGNREIGLGPMNFEQSDTAHSVEAHMRVEDDSTRTYGKAWVGYTAAISGEYSDPYGSAPVVDGELGYGGADFGWHTFGDDQSNGAGVFVGYNYWNNSPRTNRASFTTAASAGDVFYDDDTGVWSLPGDSVDDKIELHMLRLGLSGKMKLNEMFDLSGEVAAVPFATMSGVIGGNAGLDGDTLGPYPGCALGDACAYTFNGSATEIDGWGYGAMAEVMAGITPMENLTLRLGGRAWYVTGTYDATWREVLVTPPAEQAAPADPAYSAPDVAVQDMISTANPFSMLRYGLLAEMTYAF